MMQIITSDLDLETEFTSISDRFQYFSSALDSLLLQSDEVVDVDVDIHNLSDSLSSSPSVSVSYEEVEPLFVSEKSVSVITPIVAIALALTTTTATTTATVAAASVTSTSITTGKGMPKKKNDVTSSSTNLAMNKTVILKTGNNGLNRLPSPLALNQSSPLSWK